MAPHRRRLELAIGGLASAALITFGAIVPANAAQHAGRLTQASASQTSTPQASAPPTSTPQATTPTAPAPVPALQPGDLATSPYMGWSSYSQQVYTNGSWITAAQIEAQSDAMHAKLQKAGYNRINIDAGWNDGVDAYGRPTPSTKLYPDGLQTVIDHVHANGQKIGLYFIPGISPDVYNADLPVWNAPGCTTHDIVKQPLAKADYWGIDYALDFSNPCAAKYIDSIGAMLKSWGVDFVKLDSVTPGSGITDGSVDSRDDVAAWSNALHSRGIWLELSWALDPDYADYWKKYADGWRVEWDVESYAPGVSLTQWSNIARLFPDAATWWRLTGPGGFADFDSLDVGNGYQDGLTKDERRTATTLWAIEGAELYTGDDLTKLDSFGTSLLTNPGVIKIDQAGIPARPVSTSTDHQVWYALNNDGSYTVALFNLGTTDASMTASWSDIGLSGGKAEVRDVWAQRNLGSFASGYTARDIPPHGVRLLTVTPSAGTTSTVNDDAQQIGYNGDWTRNDNNEVAARSEDLTVSVAPPGTTPSAPHSSTNETTTLNNDDSSITYTGSWSDSTGRGLGDYDDDVQYTQQNGDSFQLDFTGTGVEYLTEKDVSQGQDSVYLDGELVAQVDTSLPAGTPRQAQQVVWSADGLTDGAHTLRVVKDSGDYMLLDAITVEQPNLLTPDGIGVQQGAASDTTIALGRDPSQLVGISNGSTQLAQGTDYTVDAAGVHLSAAYLSKLPAGDTKLSFLFRGDLDDDIHAATADGAWTDFTFTGTGVAWIAPTAPDQGTVDVFVDGALAKTVDTHSDERLAQEQVFSIDHLKKGRHRIVVEKVSGAEIRSDGFRFTR